LRPVEDTVFGHNEQGDVMETEAQILQRLHGGRKCGKDLCPLQLALDSDSYGCEKSRGVGTR
jgi:hypothetical protein